MAEAYPVRAVPLAPADRPYVDWGAIFAGGILAAAVSSILVTFGSAVGLSLSSPFQGEGMSVKALLIAAAIYAVWVTASSFIAGGYLAGRIRRNTGTGTPHEGHVRDGAHGLIVWALGALLLIYLATTTAAGVAKSGAAMAGSALSTAASVMSGVSGTPGYFADMLLRNPATAPGPSGADAARQEVADIFAHSAISGTVTPEDKSYLSRIVAARTGLPQADADKRVDAVITQTGAAADTAKRAVEQARRAGVLLAFLTAASMAIGAAGAWWGASLGGRHRDEGTDLSHYTRW